MHPYSYAAAGDRPVSTEKQKPIIDFSALPRPGPVILGAQAGKDLRHALIMGRTRGSVTTSPLWEIGHLLCHRANMNPRELMNAQHEEVVEVLQNSRRRKLETLRGLKDTRLY